MTYLLPLKYIIVTYIIGHLESDIMINKELIKSLELYLLDHQVQFTQVSSSYVQKAKRSAAKPKMAREPERETYFEMPTPASIQIDDYIEANKKPPFQTVLFQYIDASDMTDADVYKKADIDRRLFSKIRSNSQYHPSKSTIIALGLSLELDKEKMTHLLTCGGYTLNKCDTKDLIIHYCIDHNIYSLIQVNELLDYFNEPIL